MICLYRCTVCGYEEERVIFGPVDPEMIIDQCPACQLAIMKLLPGIVNEYIFDDPS